MIAGTGCATTPRDDGEPRNADPLEPINRVSYRIHEVGDRYVLRPVARGYRAITPQPVRTGIGNVFRNLGMPVVIINGLLQGKFAQAADDTGHFLVNTTLGIGGLFDVATRAGIERSDEDFGQTLAVWGVPSGPYVFIPFMGPTTFRDGAGIFASLLRKFQRARQVHRAFRDPDAQGTAAVRPADQAGSRPVCIHSGSLPPAAGVPDPRRQPPGRRSVRHVRHRRPG